MLRRLTVLFGLTIIFHHGYSEVCLGQGFTLNIVRSGEAAGPGETWDLFSENIAINNASEVAFIGRVNGSPNGVFDDTLLMLHTGSGLNELMRKGDATPTNNGVFNLQFDQPALNDAGQVLTFSRLANTIGGAFDDRGIFRAEIGMGNLTMVRETQIHPDSVSVFESFSDIPTLNNSGLAAFPAVLRNTPGGTTDNVGVFTTDGNSMLQIARKGLVAPGGTETYSTFGYNSGSPQSQVPVDVNNLGQTTFRATLSGTGNEGVFRGDGITPTVQIARNGQLAPDGNGTYFSFLSNPSINDQGQVAFAASLSGASGGATNGIFLGNGTTTTQIVRRNDPTPDVGANFLAFSGSTIEKFSVNNAGQVAFQASLFGSGVTSANDHGIYRGDGVSIVKIIREGDSAPDGNGAMGSISFSMVSMNSFGTVGFHSPVTGTSGGTADNEGLYLGDGIDLVQVARKGELLDGKTILNLRNFTNGNGSGGGRSGINDLGQMVYRATFTDNSSGIYVFTPDLNWRGGNGNWDDHTNWTLSLAPGFVHDVFIDSTTSPTVLGPTSDLTIGSLEIGGGTGLATLSIQQTGALTAIDGVIVQTNGMLAGSGTIIGDVESSGIIAPGNSAGLITIDGTLTLNSGSSLDIELGGLAIGQFDQLFVTGDLNLDGGLSVSLIDGFTLNANQEFLILDAVGLLSGQFSGLGEGALVGNFGGHDLFITYSAGGGNGVGLFTAVPEPSSMTLLVLGYCLLFAGRRKR